MDRTRLTVNHHVDEKYGKLALDPIKKLEEDRERRRGEELLLFSFHKEKKGAGALKLNLSSTEYGTVWHREKI